MIKWRIYYSPDEYYEERVEEAPVRGVQVILQGNEQVGWYTQSGSDFYVWWGEVWLGVDKFGLIDYFIEPGWKRVLLGRTTTNKEFKAIFNKALSDREFAVKNGYLPGERKPE